MPPAPSHAAATHMTGDELRRTFTFASAFKEGDLAVGGTADDRLRDDARRALLATTVGDIRRAPLIDDGVTAALDGSRDRHLDSELDPLTIAQRQSALRRAARRRVGANSTAMR